MQVSLKLDELLAAGVIRYPTQLGHKPAMAKSFGVYANRAATAIEFSNKVATLGICREELFQ